MPRSYFFNLTDLNYPRQHVKIKKSIKTAFHLQFHKGGEMKKALIATIILAITASNVLADEISIDKTTNEPKTPAVIQAFKIIKRDSFYSSRAAAMGPMDIPATANEEEAVRKMLEAVGDINGQYVEEDLLTFKREHIESSFVKDNGYVIAVIKLKRFSRGSADKFKKILREKPMEEINGLILDLRGNGGGYLEEMMIIASQFIGDKAVMTIEDSKGKRKTLFSVEEKDFELPMVVIVNHQTASAAEILASALQHHKIAKIVGLPTYGKAQIQNKYYIAGKILSLTTERWRKLGAESPNDAKVTPDIEIQEERNIQLETAKKVVLYKINKKAGY